MERNGGEETAAVAPGLCFSNFTEYQDHRSPRKACPKMPGLSSRVSSSLGRGQEPRWCICKSLSDINADNDPAITLGELLKVTASASSRLSCTSLQGSSQFLKMKRYVCVCWQTGGLVLCFPIARAPTLHFAQPQAQHCGLQAWWPCQEDHPAGMNACKIFQLSPVPWPAPLAGKHTGQGHPYAQRDCLLLQVSQPPPPAECLSKKEENSQMCKGFWQRSTLAMYKRKFTFSQKSHREGWQNCPVHWRVLERHPVYEQKSGAHLFFFSFLFIFSFVLSLSLSFC